jgi:hypothetical protein
LRGEPRPDSIPPFIHHGRRRRNRIHLVPALLAGARRKLRSGRTPILHMGKTNLDLILKLKLLCTTRTAHPPRRRPASPSEKREERAGAALQATLNWAEGTRERERRGGGGGCVTLQPIQPTTYTWFLLSLRKEKKRKNSYDWHATGKDNRLICQAQNLCKIMRRMPTGIPIHRFSWYRPNTSMVGYGLGLLFTFSIFVFISVLFFFLFYFLFSFSFFFSFFFFQIKFF